MRLPCGTSERKRRSKRHEMKLCGSKQRASRVAAECDLLKRTVLSRRMSGRLSWTTRTAWTSVRRHASLRLPRDEPGRARRALRERVGEFGVARRSVERWPAGRGSSSLFFCVDGLAFVAVLCASCGRGASRTPWRHVSKQKSKSKSKNKQTTNQTKTTTPPSRCLWVVLCVSCVICVCGCVCVCVCVSKGCLCVCVCLCKRVVCVDVQACLTPVLSAKTNFESTTKEGECHRRTRTSCSACVRNSARELCLRCRGGGSGTVSCCCCSRCAPLHRWGPAGVPFLFFFPICFLSCFQFPIFHFLVASFSFLLSTFFVFDKAHFFKKITGPFFHFSFFVHFRNVQVIF